MALCQWVYDYVILFNTMDVAPTSIRIPRDLRDQLEKIAKEQRRSLSNLVLLVLEQFVERYPHTK
jgi:predicted transcriptional regulator